MVVNALITARKPGPAVMTSRAGKSVRTMTPVILTVMEPIFSLKLAWRF